MSASHCSHLLLGGWKQNHMKHHWWLRLGERKVVTCFLALTGSYLEVKYIISAHISLAKMCHNVWVDCISCKMTEKSWEVILLKLFWPLSRMDLKVGMKLSYRRVKMWSFLHLWVLCPVIFGPAIYVNLLAQHLTGSNCLIDGWYHCSLFPPYSTIWFLIHSFQIGNLSYSSQAFIERRVLGRKLLFTESWSWKVLWDLSHTCPQTWRQDLTEHLPWFSLSLALWQTCLPLKFQKHNAFDLT